VVKAMKKLLEEARDGLATGIPGTPQGRHGRAHRGQTPGGHRPGWVRHTVHPRGEVDDSDEEAAEEPAMARLAQGHRNPAHGTPGDTTYCRGKHRETGAETQTQVYSAIAAEAGEGGGTHAPGFPRGSTPGARARLPQAEPTCRSIKTENTHKVEHLSSSRTVHLGLGDAASMTESMRRERWEEGQEAHEHKAGEEAGEDGS